MATLRQSSLSITSCVVRDESGTVIGHICPRCISPTNAGEIPKLSLILDLRKHLCLEHYRLFRDRALSQPKWKAHYDVYTAWHNPNVEVEVSAFKEAVAALESIGAMGDLSYKADMPRTSLPKDQVF